MQLVVVTFKRMSKNGEMMVIHQPLTTKYLAKKNIHMEYWQEKLLEIKKFNPVGITQSNQIVCTKY